MNNVETIFFMSITSMQKVKVNGINFRCLIKTKHKQKYFKAYRFQNKTKFGLQLKNK